MDINQCKYHTPFYVTISVSNVVNFVIVSLCHSILPGLSFLILKWHFPSNVRECCDFTPKSIKCQIIGRDSLKILVIKHSHSPHFDQTIVKQIPQSSYIPADTFRNNDVVIKSKPHHFDVITSKWRRFDVITTLLLRHVFGRIPQLEWCCSKRWFDNRTAFVCLVISTEHHICYQVMYYMRSCHLWIPIWNILPQFVLYCTHHIYDHSYNMASLIAVV